MQVTFALKGTFERVYTVAVANLAEAEQLATADIVTAGELVDQFEAITDSAITGVTAGKPGTSS